MGKVHGAVLSPVSLKTGDDKIAAKELTKRFKEAQNGMRRIVALGLLAWEIKESRLKKKQFGPWLIQHAPNLARVREDNGAIQVSSSLNSYMQLTQGVLESIGLTIEKYLSVASSNTQSLGIQTSGSFLILPEKKVSQELLELRNKIFAVIDGKTAKQLFLEFKQAEEDEDGNAKPKVGRLKGQGGASAAQRAKYKALTEAAQIEADKLKGDEFMEWIDEAFDASRIDKIDDDKWREKLCDRLLFAARYLQRKEALPK